ncbi:hypothetical protein HNY73_017780 [Argiope bruennichi]|uniref:Uncharacterized protein n=1 Tax=Argiope bruennichi TaxID=94029 RepID=A0A8T0EC66_ARGBR|nr:hypothetical protein HNY73_017780 [Argiope bruennichi]
MSKNHLFSSSLFDTLFQHNLISSDGYVKANDDQILAFRQFLVQQARDKTTNLYKKRKEIVDDVSRLLKEDELSMHDTKKLILLLHELNLKITPEGLLEDEEPGEREPSYLGTSEPNKSIWERQLLAEERRLEVLRRDLKDLDNWLSDINKPDARVHKSAIRLPADSKRDELRYRARTNRRNQDMDRARRRLITKYDVENMKSIKRTLAYKDHPGRVRFTKNVASTTGQKKESVESFVTAASSFILLTPEKVTRKEMDLARNIFDSHILEVESSLRVKKSTATEKIDVLPGVKLDAGEKFKFLPTKDIETYVSEPIMVRYDSDVALKSKRYKSDSMLEEKAMEPIIDNIKQCIVISEDEGKITEFLLPGVEEEAVKKTKPDSKKDKPKITTKADDKKAPSEFDSRKRGILKVSRKKIDMSSSSKKKVGSMKPNNDNRTSKESSVENRAYKNGPISKQQSTEDSKGRKTTKSSSLAKKNVPGITQGEKEIKPVDKDNDENKAKIDNQRKIIDARETKDEKKTILKTMDPKDENKHQDYPQVNRKPNLTQGKLDNKNHDELRDKKVKYHPEIEPKGDEAVPSLERRLKIEKDFEMAQRSERNKDDFDEGKSKQAMDNKEGNIDSPEKSKKKEDSPKNDDKSNMEKSPKLKDVAENINDDDKTITSYSQKETKKDPVLTKDKDSELEKDFQLAQRYEMEKSDPKSKNEEAFVSKTGSDSNANDKPDEKNIKSDKEEKDSAETNPEDSGILTLDQQLSRESEISSKKSKERRKGNSNTNNPENDANINAANPARRSDFSENAEQNANQSKPEPQSSDEKVVEENKNLSLDQQLSVESETNSRKKKQSASKQENFDSNK